MNDQKNPCGKLFLYTGAFRFPDGDAAAFRVLAVAQLLQGIGNTVEFAGWEAGTSDYLYQGHRCYPQGEFRSGPANPLARLLGFVVRGRRTLAWLRTRPHYDAVIAYNPPALFALLLLVWGKLRGTSIVLDTTEWYDSRHLPGGRFGPAALENWLRMQLCYRLYRHAIVISTFLERHLQGRHLVRLPPLSAHAALAAQRGDPAQGIHIVYAGEAGRKDSLAQFVLALPALALALARPVQLHIAGMDQAALEALLAGQGLATSAAGAVRCYGRVSRERVLALYAECHFSVLFREDARYAHAGFPTKAMESWSNGCPLITNAVGDLQALARHMGNALVLEESTLAQALPALLREATGAARYAALVQGSVDTARQHFAPQAYTARLAAFVAGLTT